MLKLQHKNFKDRILTQVQNIFCCVYNNLLIYIRRI